MAKEFSPEEKLLNLIKKKKHADIRENTIKEDTPKKEYPEATKEHSRQAKTALDFQKFAKLENLKFLNMIFFATLVLLLLYFVVDIFLVPQKKVALQKEDIKALIIKEPEIKPYTYYTKNLTAKDVFTSLQKDQPASIAPEFNIEDLMANFSLLGIVAGDEPQAIIEDGKQKKSYFLRKGQSRGGLLLKNIGEGSVTIVYKGQEFDLTM